MRSPKKAMLSYGLGGPNSCIVLPWSNHVLGQWHCGHLYRMHAMAVHMCRDHTIRLACACRGHGWTTTRLRRCHEMISVASSVSMGCTVYSGYQLPTCVTTSLACVLDSSALTHVASESRWATTGRLKPALSGWLSHQPLCTDCCFMA